MASRKKDGSTAEVGMCGPTGPNSTVRLCLTRDKGPISSKPLYNDEDVCNFFREKGVGAADRESFYALHLDARNNVVGMEEVAKGSVDGVNVHPREVFKSAILSNATAILIAHNHPSGDPTPSKPDYELTSRLVDAGKLLGIPIMDHVVVSDKSCTSLRADGKVRFLGAGLGGAETVKRSRRK